MLREERTYINLSFGLYLELMERQTCLKRQMLHQQICNKLYTYHCIYAFSVSHSNLVYLKVTLKPSPETFYAVMLLPYRHDLRCSEFSTKHHDTINSLAVFEKQQQHLTKRRAFCFFSNCRYSFTSPSTLLKLDVLLMELIASKI